MYIHIKTTLNFPVKTEANVSLRIIANFPCSNNHYRCTKDEKEKVRALDLTNLNQNGVIVNSHNGDVSMCKFYFNFKGVQKECKGVLLECSF